LLKQNPLYVQENGAANSVLVEKLRARVQELEAANLQLEEWTATMKVTLDTAHREIVQVRFPRTLFLTKRQLPLLFTSWLFVERFLSAEASRDGKEELQGRYRPLSSFSSKFFAIRTLLFADIL
jgi:hypothetical protein